MAQRSAYPRRRLGLECQFGDLNISKTIYKTINLPQESAQYFEEVKVTIASMDDLDLTYEEHHVERMVQINDFHQQQTTWRIAGSPATPLRAKTLPGNLRCAAPGTMVVAESIGEGESETSSMRRRIWSRPP
ncbi:hypothetical protein LZ554_003641 [Drepanopeziza brunnea f. sp. 'monogermtubi']|nr:hypothetical protein LZ554_003641 [Drepanopeziza brunnea f. sp. 'monogermtubi']